MPSMSSSNCNNNNAYSECVNKMNDNQIRRGKKQENTIIRSLNNKKEV